MAVDVTLPSIVIVGLRILEEGLRRCSREILRRSKEGVAEVELIIEAIMSIGVSVEDSKIHSSHSHILIELEPVFSFCD